MRILAVDYGTKRVGLATGDDAGLCTRGVRTLTSQGIKRDAHRLIEWAQDVGAQSIIVGLPLPLSGAMGASAQRAKKLVAQLRKLTKMPVTLWDERLTSEAAEAWMAEQGLKRGQRHAIRDQIAACLILEDYLAHKRYHEPNKIS